MRAVICCALVVGLLLPSAVACAGVGLVTAERNGPWSPEQVQQGRDHWWVEVVKVIVYWIGGICFERIIRYWEWRGKDQPEEVAEQPPGPWMYGDEPPPFKADRYPD